MKTEEQIRFRLEELEQKRLDKINETVDRPGIVRPKKLDAKIEALQWVLDERSDGSQR